MYYITTVVKTIWLSWRDRHKDQSNRLETPETGSHKYRQLIFDKGSKANQNEKQYFFHQIILNILRPKNPQFFLNLITYTITQNGS